MDGGAQSSHQLDFYQAMTDFKLMFPNMDEEIIEAVLRANGGAVDGTIDQLLTMNTDFDQPAVAASISIGSRPPCSAKVKRILELSGRDRLPASETSTSSCGNDSASNLSRSAFGRPVGSKSSAGSSVDPEAGQRRYRKAESCGISSLSSNMSEDLLLLETTADESQVFGDSADVRDGAVGGENCATSWGDADFLPATPAPPIPPRSPLHAAPPLPPKMSLMSPPPAVSSGRGTGGNQMPPDSRKKAKSWDPPLLGKLPDDFLRLDIGPHAKRSFRTSSAPTHQSLLMTHSMPDATARTRNPCQEAASPLPSARVQPLRLSSETGHGRGQSTGTHHSHRSNDDGVLSLSHACECKRHSSGALERPLGSRRHIEIDANTWQMLEDERLALVLQSEEFLTELRQNEDFMRSLEHERQLRPSDVHDILPVLDKSSHTDDSAEFRTMLKHIGDSSRKKLITAAHKFFAKCKRKSQKPILKDSVAPSTVNLLDEEETNNKDAVDEDMPFADEQYKWWSQH